MRDQYNSTAEYINSLMNSPHPSSDFEKYRESLSLDDFFIPGLEPNTGNPPPLAPPMDAATQHSEQVYLSRWNKPNPRPESSLSNSEEDTSSVSQEQPMTPPLQSSQLLWRARVRTLLREIQLVFEDIMAKAAAKGSPEEDLMRGWELNCPSLGSVDKVWKDVRISMSRLDQKIAAIQCRPEFTAMCRHNWVKEVLEDHQQTILLDSGFRSMVPMLCLLQSNHNHRKLFEDAGLDIPGSFADVEKLIQFRSKK